MSARFCKPILEVRRKYQILWFAVDLPHRQRYFFIYGCERTVKKTQRKGSQSNPLRAANFAAIISLWPRFPCVAKDSPDPRAYALAEAGFLLEFC
jgi:hypothetical protein